ncbi:hypothetical protein CKAN_01511000 [Cinnamomum micranthum f. kanehirae]|uniref:Uncharacterized protein n=1 Tax=Cinnamomum micranthum f. kanehirae TaxID=337451 RepID=A0A3S3N6C7_9MAGN|nr:hypothetical protein CKAN_01511000 [Cinnamomum micranthum f. kanehirae]
MPTVIKKQDHVTIKNRCYPMCYCDDYRVRELLPQCLLNEVYHLKQLLHRAPRPCFSSISHGQDRRVVADPCSSYLHFQQLQFTWGKSGKHNTSQNCSSLYSPSGSRLLRRVPSNIAGSCGMMLSLDLRSCSPMVEMSTPSIRT